MRHEIKILPEYFEDKIEGIKDWEIRFNDRDYQVGDILIEQEWSEDTSWTGRCMEEEIKAVYKNLPFVKEGYVVLSTRQMKGRK